MFMEVTKKQPGTENEVRFRVVSGSFGGFVYIIIAPTKAFVHRMASCDTIPKSILKSTRLVNL